MMSSIKILPERLEELRKNSGYDLEEIAKELEISVDNLRNIEKSGELDADLLKKLADLYKVPLVAFFSETLPKMPELMDYRLNRERKLTPEVFVAKRRAIYLSREIMELSGKKSIIPEIYSAQELREYLNIERVKGRPREIFDYYRDRVEDKLNIMVIEYPLGENVRAFSIYSDLAVIVLNEHDEPPVKLFSLFHELPHLIKRRESSLCSIELESEDEIERSCNEFSAEFLVPTEELKEEIAGLELKDRNIKNIARKFGVSVQVIMIRLLKLKAISPTRYQEFKEKFDKEKVAGGGFKDWERTFENRAGKLAISEVRKAYMDGRLGFYEAMRILDLKLKYAQKLLE
ncbi:MAG: XRE family transcriptional regulator [Archaeoglobales archaeon]|nr:XRE family transcriptional regulator [Archaeoglobales archaeon]